jgi:hypothetical protein
MALAIPTLGYKNLSATANASPNPVTIQGFFINSAAATATIQFYDDSGTGTSTPIGGAITIPAGGLGPAWYPMPVSTTKGLYVVIGVAAANITIC